MDSEPVVFNPFDPEWRHDRYPYFARLRAEAPSGQVPGLPIWYVTRFADCEAVLRDRRAGSDTRKSQLYRMLAESAGLRMPGDISRRRSFLLLDPPDHTRLRGLVSRAFTPRVVQALRRRIEEIVDDALDAAAARGRFDVIDDLAYPVPFTVICELLGVPVEDHARFRAWSKVMAATIDPQMNASPEVLERQVAVMRENIAYFEDLVEERRRSPRDDLLRALIEAEDAGDRLSQDELVATLILLVAAGHETVVNLIGNGVLALLQHPEQWQRLLGDPNLAANVVEEVLRWDPPVQLTQRIALEDMEVAGHAVPAGAPIVMVLAAANRDEAQTADPERFDVCRSEIRHLAFVAGPHYCLGAALGRTEGEIVLRSLAGRLPRLRLADPGQLRWRDSMVVHGLERFPVELG